MENSTEGFLKKPELPYDTVISLLGIYSDKLHPNVQSSTIYNRQDMEAT